MTNVPPPASPAASAGLTRGLILGAVVSIGFFTVLGLIGAVVAASAVKKKEADVRKGWNLVPVVVAAVDIAENTVVKLEMVSQRSIPEQFVTSSVVKPDSASYIINQRVLVPLQQGDPLLWSQFETTKAAERLSEKVREHGRIVAVKTAPEASVGRWVRPNDHVDVIAVFVAPDTKEPTAMTVLENVVVAATGTITGTTNVNLMPEGTRAYGEVSLYVAPDEAERLALMASLGTLTLTLRSEKDDATRPKAPKTTLKSVLGR